MVKHTRTIQRLLPTNCQSVFDHFMGLAPNGLKNFAELMAEINDKTSRICQWTFVDSLGD